MSVWLSDNSSASILTSFLLMFVWKSLATRCEELTHWKRPWCWERLRTGREGGDKRWDGWMASPTQWAWVWAYSGREWRTGKPGVLQSTGLQTVRHNEWLSTHTHRHTQNKYIQRAYYSRLGVFKLISQKGVFFSSNFFSLLAAARKVRW